MPENSRISKVSIGMPVYNGESKPLITTVIPTYRRPKLLRRAIKSVLNQTYPHFQVCVYDNASGDETASVVTEFAKRDFRVKYHCHPENIGAIKNFIYGMEHVKTPFFSFLSDDDVLLPDFYKQAIAALQCGKDLMFAATQVIAVTENGEVVGRPPDHFPPGIYEPPVGFSSMIECGPPTWIGILFRSEVLKNVGPLDINVGGPSDFEWELRIASMCKYIVIDQPGALFVVHESSASSTGEYSVATPKGRMWMYERIKTKYDLPMELRVRALDVLAMRHQKGLRRYGLRSILNRNLDGIKSVSNVIQFLYQKRVESKLWKVIAIMTRNRSLQACMSQALRVLKLFYRNNLKCGKSDKDYSLYKSYLRNL